MLPPYAEVRTDVEKKITSSRFYYSATTDLWSSCTTEPYLVTIFILLMMNGACKVIACRHILCLYVIRSLFYVQDWNLDEARQVVITTDNASNIRLACQLLKWRQLTCFGHNLDLAVRKGLSDHRVNRVLHLSRQIVTAFY